MSEKLCELKKKGGGTKSTADWQAITGTFNPKIDAKEAYIMLAQGSFPTLKLNGTLVTEINTNTKSGFANFRLWHFLDVKTTDTFTPSNSGYIIYIN